MVGAAALLGNRMLRAATLVADAVQGFTTASTPTNYIPFDEWAAEEFLRNPPTQQELVLEEDLESAQQ